MREGGDAGGQEGAGAIERAAFSVGCPSLSAPKDGRVDAPKTPPRMPRMDVWAVVRADAYAG
jgi:hypothetical protein